MIDKIDRRWITNDFLLTYFSSPDRFIENFPYLKRNSNELKVELQKIRNEWDEERKKDGEPLLTEEEWTRIAKNAYPIPDLTLAVSQERYLFFKKKLNEERQRSGKSPWSDSDIASFIKNAEGYLILSKELRPNKDFSR